ncbi:MAG: GDP-mannose 4,6-dehydratase [Candidatus Kerfeldbacteria bacterium]|nr:GDP-mannose 4,6-dehydratase [Candidatus Kerfeldbacteria bacterium]
MLNFRGKNILITGGAGFIGSHLIDQLITEQPRNIIVVDNLFLGKLANLKDAQKNFPRLIFYRHDASDYSFMKRLVAKHRIHVIYNLATKALPYSFTDPEDAYLINVKLSTTLLRLLLDKQYQTLIHFSSSEAYGSSLTSSMSELHPLVPHTPYAAGKASADLQVMAWRHFFKLDIAIIRPFNNYGPRQNEGMYAGVIPITIKRIMKGQPPILQGDGKQTRDFIYVTDTARAAIAIYKNPRTRGTILNIASGKELSIKKIIASISKLMNYHGPVIKKPSRTADVRRHLANVSMAKKILHFKQSISFTTGIAKTIEWYKHSV